MRSWDGRNQRFSVSYDTLRRPVDRTVSVNGGSEKLLGRVVYGEMLASPAASNHRGQVYRVYDGAGVATSLGFDFKGQPISEERQVAQKTSQPDWSALLGESTIAEMATAAASLLDAETFSVSSQHDALGRVLTAVSPDGSEVHYSYDEGGGLQTVSLNHRGSVSEETVVGDIIYDAQGRREKVLHGSSSSPTTTTSYTYDPIAQRLTRLRTVRHSDDAAIQSLHYHYDPVGNITDIRDTAQQTVYFQNSVVAAANSYEYDALYRLVEATGREHSTQGTGQRTHEQLPVGAQPMSSDPSAMRRYTQKFSYDGVGNILEMQHLPNGGTGGWTRHYEYDTNGNRLLATSAPGDDAEGPYTHTYSYDAHGSMTEMPHLPSMVWNHDDELEEVTAGTETVYFQYAGGIRSRKFTEKSGTVTEERIYLGPFEIYRKRINGDLDLERESLHISDGSGRICIVETKTVEDEDAVVSPTGIWRYQHGNHLGSAATEVDGSGAIISYEEYHPYGTSAYRAVNSSIEVSAKRYRYTGMEQDEETGLAYHSARYYANWLGRWTASDPIGLGDGVNRFCYTEGQPSGAYDINGKEGEHNRHPLTTYSITNNRAGGINTPVNVGPGATGTIFVEVNQPTDKATKQIHIDNGEKTKKARELQGAGLLTTDTLLDMTEAHEMRSTFNVRIDLESSTVTVEMAFYARDSIYNTPEARQQIEDEIEQSWSNQVVFATPDGRDADREPDAVFSVSIDVEWVDDPNIAHRQITIVPDTVNNSRGGKDNICKHMGLESGILSGTGESAAHEFGHALGLPDEYGITVVYEGKNRTPRIIDHDKEIQAGRQEDGVMNRSELSPTVSNFDTIKAAFAKGLNLSTDDIMVIKIPHAAEMETRVLVIGSN